MIEGMQVSKLHEQWRGPIDIDVDHSIRYKSLLTLVSPSHRPNDASVVLYGSTVDALECVIVPVFARLIRVISTYCNQGIPGSPATYPN